MIGTKIINKTASHVIVIVLLINMATPVCQNKTHIKQIIKVLRMQLLHRGIFHFKYDLVQFLVSHKFPVNANFWRLSKLNCHSEGARFGTLLFSFITHLNIVRLRKYVLPQIVTKYLIKD